MRKISQKELDNIRGVVQPPKPPPKLPPKPPPKDYAREIAQEALKSGIKNTQDLKNTIEDGFRNLTSSIDVALSVTPDKREKMRLTFDIVRDSEKLIAQVEVREH